MDALNNTGQLLLLVPLTQRVSPAGGMELAGLELGLCTETGLELHDATDAMVSLLHERRRDQ